MKALGVLRHLYVQVLIAIVLGIAVGAALAACSARR